VYFKSSYRFPYCLKDYLNPKHYVRYAKGFWQRGTRGYAYSDLWSFDHYMASILVQALPTFKNSHPDNISYFILDKDAHLLFDVVQESDVLQRAMDEWDAMIDNIVTILYTAYVDEDTSYHLDAEEYEKVQGVMFDFAKYFGHFWN